MVVAAEKADKRRKAVGRKSDLKDIINYRMQQRRNSLVRKIIMVNIITSLMLSKRKNSRDGTRGTLVPAYDGRGIGEVLFRSLILPILHVKTRTNWK